MTDAVLEKKLRIRNKKGLHARAAAKFVKLAESFPGAEVEVIKDGQSVGGASIMGLLMLAASLNSEIAIRVTGKGNGCAAFDALVALVEDGFGEE